MVGIIFFLSFVLLWLGWFELGFFLFVIAFIRWELKDDEIMYKKQKEETEKECAEINAYQERKHEEALEELRKEKYPDLFLNRSSRAQRIRTLSRHERTGHITEPEKELLEVLKASM